MCIDLGSQPLVASLDTGACGTTDHDFASRGLQNDGAPFGTRGLITVTQKSVFFSKVLNANGTRIPQMGRTIDSMQTGQFSCQDPSTGEILNSTH